MASHESQHGTWRIVCALRWPRISDCEGPVEVDEAYIGGKEANKHESGELKGGCGAVGKAAKDANVYTDDTAAYRYIQFNHKVVRHSVQQCVGGRVHTNEIESF